MYIREIYVSLVVANMALTFMRFNELFVVKAVLFSPKSIVISQK